MKHAVVLMLAALLAGCGGYSHLGLSREEHRAYVRSDSSCDGPERSNEPACYVPRRDCAVCF